MAALAKTLFEKVWAEHLVAQEDDQTLLYIDRQYLHEGAFHAFVAIEDMNLPVRRPDRNFAVPDHYTPTRGRIAIPKEDDLRIKIETLASNADKYGIPQIAFMDQRQGIVHVIGPEQGLTLPGMTITCGDSHTGTHGACGAIAFGIGASEVAHVLATQTLWARRPKVMRVWVDGQLPQGVVAKDLILAIIAKIGAAGGSGHSIEYAGPAIRALSMEGRLTVCNMSIEAGARCGMVAPDDTTFNYLAGRPYAPQGAAWERLVAHWRTLPSDDNARWDKEVRLDASTLEPTVTWGTSPQDALPISGHVPDPASFADPVRRATVEKALAYMDLKPGTALEGLPVDQVFIGSCTNSRIEDLRAAAHVVRGRKAKVPTLVSPGSGLIKAAAEAEGLAQIFRDAGFEWADAGCSMCVGMNGDLVEAGKRCASTSNRNFEGRQGKNARTHLMSPAMAAAAAVTGRLADVRKWELPA